ncbi:GNAT family N-acetyltransferase [Roseburia hominis]
MIVRRLQNEEILDALHLVWEVFAEEVAPLYSRQGVEQFQQFIKLEQFMPRVQSGETVVFGVLEENQLVGASAIGRNGHILLLFVRKKWQRKGAARLLVQAMYEYGVLGLSLFQLTVNASPNAVEAYRHMGFMEAGMEQEQDGIRFVPMIRRASPADIRPQQKGKSHKGLIAGVIIGILALLILLGFLFGKMVNTIIKQADSHKEEYFDPRSAFGDAWGEAEPKTDQGEEEFSGNEEGDSEEEGEGIESISCYAADELPYTIKEETYTYSSGNSSSYRAEFDVKYPQLEWKDGKNVDKVNEMLKECAMSTVNTLYLNPSNEMKESLLKEENLMLASQVTYKVTYASEDFISVAFNDYYFAGNIYASYVDLRTRNIRLSDGQEFRTADIVELGDEFMDDWMVRMKEEAPGAEVLSGLKQGQFKRILSGEILENRYYDNFFVDAEGLEIGLTYHYRSEGENPTIARGWITAPYTQEEVRAYKTDSEFWNLVQSND